MFKQKVDWASELNSLQKLLDNKLSLTSIAKQYGVSKQRLFQIISRYKLEYTAQKKTKKDLNSFNKHYSKKDILLSIKKKKFRDKKRNALNNNVPFNLDFNDIKWPSICPVLGIELDYLSTGVNVNTPTFDKINPEFGYISNNTIIISHKANRIKNNASLNELKLVYEFFKNNGLN